MSLADFREALKFTLKWEGGFVDDPVDPGGATNFGITQGTYNAYRDGKKLPRQSVKLITRLEVEDCYQKRYWEPSHAYELPLPVAIAVFDTAVQWGVAGGDSLILGHFHQKEKSQQVSGFAALKASKESPQHLADQICDARAARRLRVVEKRPQMKKFLRGWQNRDADLRRFCRERAVKPPT